MSTKTNQGDVSCSSKITLRSISLYKICLICQLYMAVDTLTIRSNPTFFEQQPYFEHVTLQCVLCRRCHNMNDDNTDLYHEKNILETKFSPIITHQNTLRYFIPISQHRSYNTRNGSLSIIKHRIFDTN